MKRLGSMIFVLALVACGGGSSNPEPSPDAALRPDSGVIDAGAIDAAVADAGADADLTPDANCEGDGGCYACEPHTGTEILNHCTSGQCQPFDNEARLPRYNHGNLPPAP